MRGGDGWSVPAVSAADAREDLYQTVDKEESAEELCQLNVNRPCAQVRDWLCVVTGKWTKDMIRHLNRSVSGNKGVCLRRPSLSVYLSIFCAPSRGSTMIYSV